MAFDLVIVSDVASYFMDPYCRPPPWRPAVTVKKNLASMGGGCGSCRQTELDLKITGIVSLMLLILAIILLVFCRAGRLDESWLSPSVACHPGVSAGGAGHRIKEGNPMIGRLAGPLGASDKRAGRFLKGRGAGYCQFLRCGPGLDGKIPEKAPVSACWSKC